MRLKYKYSVISVIVDSLPGNTKNRESTRSWPNRVRLFAWDALSIPTSFYQLEKKKTSVPECLDLIPHYASSPHRLKKSDCGQKNVP